MCFELGLGKTLNFIYKYNLIVFLTILFDKFLVVQHLFLKVLCNGFFVDSQNKCRSVKKSVIVIFGKSMLGRQGLSLVLGAKGQFNIILAIIFQIFKPKNVLFTLIFATPFPLDSLH